MVQAIVVAGMQRLQQLHLALAAVGEGTGRECVLFAVVCHRGGGGRRGRRSQTMESASDAHERQKDSSNSNRRTGGPYPKLCCAPGSFGGGFLGGLVMVVHVNGAFDVPNIYQKSVFGVAVTNVSCLFSLLFTRDSQVGIHYYEGGGFWGGGSFGPEPRSQKINHENALSVLLGPFPPAFFVFCGPVGFWGLKPFHHFPCFPCFR